MTNQPVFENPEKVRQVPHKQYEYTVDFTMKPQSS
jgi:hypothetical protein